MTAFWSPPEQITIRRSAWRHFLAQVAERGQARREAGGFLLAEPGSRRVTKLVPYDDLDPHCLVGSISFSGHGFTALWDLCDRDGLRPIADLHTHPTADVRQSAIDREHPMISRPGYLSLIAPQLLVERAQRTAFGAHVYDGEDGWTSHFGRAARRRIRLVTR